MFIPVPPKISLQKITLKAQAKAIGCERYIELYQNAYDAYLAK